MNPSQEFSLKGRDDYTFVAYAWLPTSEKALKSLKGIVQISHGMAEHASRYGRFAEALIAAGYGVYANDHRGHGKTAFVEGIESKNNNDIGFFAEKDGWSHVVNDMHILNQKIKADHPTLPVFLFAHSMGTFISQQYISEHGDELSGVMLSASIADAGFLRKVGLMIAKLERLRIGQRGQSKLLNAMSFGDFNKPFKPNRTEFDWITRDTAEVDKYIADPQCGFIVSTQLWIDLLEGLGVLAQHSTRSSVPNDLPIMLISGSEDPVTQQGKTVDELKDAYVKAGNTDVSVKKYLGGRHESLNEINRDEVTADLIAWMDNTFVK
ncbi:MAG: alpha/beta hydrolase [Cocleimonas sp.]